VKPAKLIVKMTKKKKPVIYTGFIITILKI